MTEPDTRLAFHASRLLNEYFHPSVSMGGGSKTGQQLQKCELFTSVRMRPCPLCRQRERKYFDWCKRRQEYIEEGERRGQNRPPFENGNPMPEWEMDDCSKCKGEGFVEGRARLGPITARPTGGSLYGAFVEPASAADAAQASIVMRRVARHVPKNEHETRGELLRDVLLAHDGPAGDFMEKNIGDRLIVVVTLTEIYDRHISPEIEATKRKRKPLKSMVEASEALTELAEYLQELKAWQTTLDPIRKMHWRSAELQAQGLLTEAKQLWEKHCA